MARSNRGRSGAIGAAKVKQNGNGGGKGGGKGAGVAGNWLFVPASGPSKKSTPRSQGQGPAPMMAPWAMAKGGGKGSKGKGKVMNWMSAQKAAAPRSDVKQQGRGKSSGRAANGKGGGSQGGNKPKVVNAELEKLQPLDASLKVWVAGLDEKTNWKKVKEHFKDAGTPKVAMMPNGKACIAFATADEAESAIASFNGSDLGGKTLEVDVWTQKEKKTREPKSKKGDQKKALVKTGFAAKNAKGKKGKESTAGKSDIWEKLRVIDIPLKVRVSNLAEDVTWQNLKKHFKDNGAPCKMLDIMKKVKGTACVAFETEGEADSAIAAVSGSDLNGQSLEVTPWTKPERTERKKKEDN